MSSAATYDFFGLKIAVAVSSFGAGAAPLGSASKFDMPVVARVVAKKESRWYRKVSESKLYGARATRVPALPHKRPHENAWPAVGKLSVWRLTCTLSSTFPCILAIAMPTWTQVTIKL